MARKRKMKSIPWQCRQGDVLLERTNAPGPSSKTDRDPAGRIVLAHGEATGHAHVVLDRKAELFELTEAHDAQADAVVARLLKIAKDATLKHDCPGQVKPDHDPILLPAGDYEVVQQMQYSPEEIRAVLD
jgi:hypothetical protein